jgi:deazaflavin-dependent oxidoreductase (nitroreductase family)
MALAVASLVADAHPLWKADRAVSTRYIDANPPRKLVRRLAATAPGSWVFARIAHHADRLVFRSTGGRATAASWVSGLPVVMVTTTGARSGRESTTPILGVPEGGGIVLIGSNFGQAHHPAWIHNLRADPRARVTVDGATHEAVAEEVEGPERERLIELAAEIYPGFPQYVRRAAPRRIRVIRLIPS